MNERSQIKESHQYQNLDKKNDGDDDKDNNNNTYIDITNKTIHDVLEVAFIFTSECCSHLICIQY
jgi:hypothetical protein